MKKNHLFTVVCVNVLLFFVSGCMNNDLYIKVSNDKFFSFDLKQNITLNIDYGFASNNYVVLFDLYAENPLTEDKSGSLVKKEEAEPIYRAATDRDGKFSGTANVLSALSEVWLYSDYIGTLSPVKLEVNGNTVSFNQAEYITALRKSTATRALTPNQNKYPDEWLTLGDWDKLGRPNYLTSERKLPTAQTLSNINEVYVKYNANPLISRYPSLVNNNSAEVRITKSTKVYLVYINSTAAFNNAVGYFTYPTGKQPATIAETERILAFPNASTVNKIISNVVVGGALASGERIQLKYWDGKEFHEEFPAGISIGWWLRPNIFKDGNIGPATNSLPDRYSLPQLNGSDASIAYQRCVALKDAKTSQVVAIGFEDNLDKKYNDATFYLDIEEKDAIDTNIPNIPDVGTPPKDEENSFTYYGTLAFEDKWPEKHDYDMNDVMIDYKCTLYKLVVNNTVYKIVDEFTPRHQGGILTSGFGYQFTKLVDSDIHSVTIKGSQQSRYMEGKQLEPGQSHPTILLYDDLSKVLKETFTVTIETNNLKEENVLPPYNPFIFVESDIMRGKEVHLSKYTPTDKADMSLFGKFNDTSIPSEGLYYVSKYTYPFPFALNLASIKDFPIPEEKERLDKSYPLFVKWVQSEGATNKDWYKHPQK